MQTELERILLDEQRVAIGLCDRGTVDSVAYWPEPVDDLWRDVHSDEATQLARYSTVIHLRTPRLTSDTTTATRYAPNASTTRSTSTG